MELLALLAMLVGIVVLFGVLLLSIMLRLVLPFLVVLSVLFITLTAIALFPGSVIWAYLDAEKRGKPGWALALLVALSPCFALVGWPLTLLAWVVFRPEKKSADKNIGPGAMAGAPGPA